MSIAKKLGLCAGSSFFIGYAIFTACTATGNTDIFAFKDVFMPHIIGFIDAVTPYVQNPMLILEWFQQNSWISGFITIGALVGGGIARWLYGKATHEAVDVAKTESLALVNKATAEKEAVEGNLNVAINKVAAKQTVIDKQDLLITQLEREKKTIEDVASEKEQEWFSTRSRLEDERNYLTRRVAELEAQLEAKPKVA